MNRSTGSLVAAILTIATVPAAAQWLNVRAKGIPRTKDGKPDLSAPAPRQPDGRLDLSGVWEPNKYYLDPSNLLQPPTTALNDLKLEDVVLTPEGKALRERQTARALDPEHSFGGARCTPLDLHQMSGIPGFPFKIVHSTEMFVFLYENLSTDRQIFMDGRQLPKDPNPTYRGYSVGRWDGDTLVVDTAGFHESVLPGGRPHSEELHVTERFRRKDFGHLEIQFKFDDPKTYTKALDIQGRRALASRHRAAGVCLQRKRKGPEAHGGQVVRVRGSDEPKSQCPCAQSSLSAAYSRKHSGGRTISGRM